MKIKLCLLLIVCCQTLQATDPAIFRQINSAKGLSNNYINAFLEDSFGYLWIATSYGLNRYDGYSITSFYHEPENPNSINANFIQDIKEDDRKNIWIADEQGLSRYSYATGTFKRFPLTGRLNKNEEEEQTFYIYTIFPYKNLLYIGTDNGIFTFSTETGRTNKIFIKGYHITNVRSIWREQNDFLWFSSNDDIYKYNTKTGNIKCYPTSSGPWDKQNEASVRIRTDKYHHIWAGAPNGIYQYDAVQDRMIKKFHVNGNIDLQIEDSVAWVATWDRGLVKYNLNDLSSTNFLYTGKIPYELSSNVLTALYIDKNRNLWIGTGGKGVNLYNTHTSFFRTFKHEYNDPLSLSSSQIRAITCDSKNRCWIGTNFGLNLYNPANNTFTPFLSNKLYTNDGVLNNFVLSLCEDNEGKLWVGTLAGLNILNPEKKEYEIFDHSPKYAPLTRNQIWHITKDENGWLWIGTRSGLYHFNPNGFSFKTYMFDPKDSPTAPNRNNITSVLPEEDRIWVGTKKGLLRINSAGKITVWTARRGSPGSLLSDQINSIYRDREKRIWISTNRGLNRYISDEKGFKSYSHERLRNIQLLDILQDASGMLWITSNQRLIRFDPDRETFDTFTTQDGLIGNEFCPGALFGTDKDVFYAGGVDGLNIFSPEKIHRINEKANLHFTQFKLLDEIQTAGTPGSPLKQNIDLTDKIELSHNQNFFSISYTSVNLSDALPQQYTYILEGFDAGWNRADNRRTAYYTKVPPGNYIFKVKLFNPDHPEMETTVKSIAIIIRKPFYASWWAYCFYIVTGLFLLYLFRQYTLINIREKNNLLLSRIEKEKEEALYDLKVKFFMNVSHEFRTPLTLINGPVQKLLEEDKNYEHQKLLAIVQKNSGKLLHLVDQLLEFRKIETGTLQLRVAENDIITHTSEILSAFEELSERQSVQTRLKTDIDRLDVWFDTDMYEKILFNLLSNAFKFTPPGGRITVHVFRKQKETEIIEKIGRFIPRKKKLTKDYAGIAVEDTGPGIPPDKTEKIFDRFYQIKADKTGTGIGLSLVKNLVELHKGYISVESKPGAGSRFEVLLPLGNRHFAPENVIEKSDASYTVDSKPVSNEEPPGTEENNTGTKTDIIDISLEDDDKPLLLIVEDNSDIVTYLKNSLENTYRVLAAENGKTGVKKALRYIPDLILCDINMPVMNGIEMTKKIKANELTSHVPVILVTALASLENELEGLTYGADDYITKPFNLQVLELKIRNLLFSRRELQKKFGQEMILEQVGPRNIDTDDKFLERFNTFLTANLSNPDLDVDYIAGEMATSRSQLYRKIKLTTGMSVKIYVRTYRLIYAKKMLHNKNVRISEIMECVGIGSRSYFIKSFKKLYNMTPTEYQERLFSDDPSVQSGLENETGAESTEI